MSRRICADDSVLVVVDVQPHFLDKVDSAVATALVGRVAWLVELSQRLGVCVVVTEEEPERNGATHPLVSGVLPPSHPRHRKATFGLAGTSSILQAVQSHARSTVVLVGLETDVCVAQSALGLLDEGLRVAVVSDAVASPGSAHRQGLQRMRQEGVTLVGTKGLAYEWIGSVDRLSLLPTPPPPGLVL